MVPKKELKTEFLENMKDWNSSEKCNSGRFKRNAFSQNEKVEFLGLVYHWLRFRFRFQEAEQKKLKSSFSRPVPGRWRPKHWLGDILGSAPPFLPSLLEPAGGGLFLGCRFVDSAGIAEFSSSLERWARLSSLASETSTKTTERGESDTHTDQRGLQSSSIFKTFLSILSGAPGFTNSLK